MLKYFDIYGFKLPTYGCCVLLGLVVCNIIAIIISKKKRILISDFFLFEVASGIVGVFFAKVFSLTMDLKEGITLPLSFETLDKGGFSYYGGLFGFFITFYLLSRIIKINVGEYERNYVFLIPLLHMFWKTGCFLGGCCFGIPYTGKCAVVFPPDVNVLSGTSVFPIQIVEALGALVITLVLLLFPFAHVSRTGFFFFSYGLERFAFEFFRYHKDGSLISETHILSLLCIFVGIIIIKQRDIQNG